MVNINSTTLIIILNINNLNLLKIKIIRLNKKQDSATDCLHKIYFKIIHKWFKEQVKKVISCKNQSSWCGYIIR